MACRNYEAPPTISQLVNEEGTFFCVSSEVTNPGPTPAGINEHSINIDFGGDFSSGWDTDPTTTTTR